MRLLVAGLITGALLLLTGAAHAQRAPEWDYCDAKNLGTPDVRIRNCTILINTLPVSATRESICDRTVAYYNRALVYSSQRAYGYAITDLSEAIRIDPTYAAASNRRGSAD